MLMPSPRRSNYFFSRAFRLTAIAEGISGRLRGICPSARVISLCFAKQCSEVNYRNLTVWHIRLCGVRLRDLGSVRFKLEDAGDGMHGGGDAHGTLHGFAGQAMF